MSEEEIEFVKVVDVGEPCSVTSRRDASVHRVAEALVGEEMRCVLLTLWDDEVSAFNNGDVIEVKNGYTSLFSDFLRLNIGRHGTAEKVERDIEEVNIENNLSEKLHEFFWHRPFGRSFKSVECITKRGVQSV